MTCLRPIAHCLSPIARDQGKTARGFSLIEMIGVLAVMAILAATIVPATVRTLDRAAVRAEADNLRAISAHTKLYLRDLGALPPLPPSTTWYNALAPYADLSSAELRTNRRNLARVFIPEPITPPATAPQRVILLSSMRTGLNLPTAANINTALRFQTLWDTPENTVPSTASWTGWSAWALVTNAADFLVIERINLAPIYQTDLRTYTLTLNNKTAAPSAVTASYRVTLANGTPPRDFNLAAGTTATLTLRPRDRLDLYVPTPASAANLNHSYVVSSTGKSFDFNGSTWLPQ